MNPLVPTAADVMLGIGALAVLAYSVVALVGVVRFRQQAAGAVLLWILVIVALPIVGATAWFICARRFVDESRAA